MKVYGPGLDRATELIKSGGVKRVYEDAPLTATDGEITHDENRILPDLNRRELAAILPLVALAILMGIFPAFRSCRLIVGNARG